MKGGAVTYGPVFCKLLINNYLFVVKIYPDIVIFNYVYRYPFFAATRIPEIF